MDTQDTKDAESWAWLDVYTRSGEKWVFRKRVARDYEKTYEEMRTSIAYMLSSTPFIPMSLDDFQLVKRP